MGGRYHCVAVERAGLNNNRCTLAFYLHCGQHPKKILLWWYNWFCYMQNVPVIRRCWLVYANILIQQIILFFLCGCAILLHWTWECRDSKYCSIILYIWRSWLFIPELSVHWYFHRFCIMWHNLCEYVFTEIQNYV